MRRFLPTALGLALALLAAIAPAASAYTPLPSSGIVLRLNQLREANGIPGGVVEDASLTRGCLAHTRWMSLNRRMAHGETPGTRGYSAAGDRAGETSVLANAGSWRTGSPWLNAPMHLASMLLPELGVTGGDEHYGYSCLTTTADQSYVRARQSPTNTMFTYPGNGATAPFYQLVYEAPFSPQVTRPNPLPASQPTGPNILVYGSGPDSLSFASAVLTGPSGVVATKQINPKQLFYLPETAGLVIPKNPLEPGARYTLAVTFSGLDENFNEVSFTPAPITFTTTAKRLCGAGGSGWYREADCPAFGTRIRAVAAPKTLTRAVAVKGIKLTVRLDRRAVFVATARANGSAVGYRAARVAATGFGTVVVPVSAAKLDAAFGDADTATIAVTVQAGKALRTVRVLVSR